MSDRERNLKDYFNLSGKSAKELAQGADTIRTVHGASYFAGCIGLLLLALADKISEGYFLFGLLVVGSALIIIGLFGIVATIFRGLRNGGSIGPGTAP